MGTIRHRGEAAGGARSDAEGYRLDPPSSTTAGTVLRAVHRRARRPAEPRRGDGRGAGRLPQGARIRGRALFEEVVLSLAARATKLAGSRNLCLAGGAALNCKASQRVLESGIVDDVFVLPNAGDGGQALSAALLCSFEATARRPAPLETLALGRPSTTPQSVFSRYRLDARSRRTASAAIDLAEGSVVGWFQGRMEFGPRALGNRSILADPRSVAARDKVNRVVKYASTGDPSARACPASEARAISAGPPTPASWPSRSR
ncbi:MAG: carbamoyltransferase C-terminal domain-containing protein [Acidobacteriota bacterium]